MFIRCLLKYKFTEFLTAGRLRSTGFPGVLKEVLQLISLSSVITVMDIKPMLESVIVEVS